MNGEETSRFPPKREAVDGSTATGAAGNRPRPVLLLCAALVGLADFLFWEQPAGWTVAGYGLLLTAAVLLHGGRRPRGAASWALIGALVVLFLSCIEEPNRLTIALGALGLVSLALMARSDWRNPGALPWLARWIAFGLMGWTSFFTDAYTEHVSPSRAPAPRPSRGRLLLRWLVPVLLSGVFLAIFAVANPVIERWLRAGWDAFAGLHERLPSSARMATWLVTGLLLWGLLRFRSGLADGLGKVAGQAEGRRGGGGAWALIVRCLALLNMLFALQTGLDVWYLWGGARLPAGMTYAEYAHRGAYPLVAAALLAAVLVLVAFRAGAHGRDARWARGLVYAWLAQNVFLVVSAGWRLNLYIQVYTLTRWRVAAGVWMLLVVCGLLWILTRVAAGRSNVWLVDVNLLTALTVLYACCFVNVDGVISSYNVQHCREVRDAGPAIDIEYLERLGPDTLPALARLFPHVTDPARSAELNSAMLRLRQVLARDLANWRGWTWRRHRLAQLRLPDRPN